MGGIREPSQAERPVWGGFLRSRRSPGIQFVLTMLTAAQSSSGADRTRPPGETSEARIAKALAHPLRARILQRLGERVASPGDLALELSAPLGVVSYHVRMLRDYDCVEL